MIRKITGFGGARAQALTRRALALGILLCSSGGGASVSAADTGRIGSATIAQLQAMVDAAATANGVAGAQVAVVLGDQRADFVYGSANAELALPMTVDTIVQIGSVTKVVNAALVMTLVDEGKLALDTPVVRYIQNFKLADQRAQETITLRHLLSMSSGIDNGPYTEHGKGEDGLARYVASLQAVPHVFPPGQGFGYSNAGISVAGYAAERVAGETWDALVRKRIFEPAGLTNAVTLPEDLPFHRVAVGHAPARNGETPKVSRPWYLSLAQGPAGSTLAMSAHDLASFGRLFVNGGKAADGRRVLSEAALKNMMTPTTSVPTPLTSIGNMWGLGPKMGRWGNTVVWGHAGGTGSGASQLVWFPEKRGVLALIINTPAASSAFTAKMFSDFSAAVFGASTSTTTVADPPVNLTNARRFVGTYSRYGTRYEISEQSGRLSFKEINLGSGIPNEVTGVAAEGTLTALGNDRFLLEIPGRSDKRGVAFFGSDAQGRAVNLVAPNFPARRVTS